MKHRKLLSTLLAASMTISAAGNLAPTVFADTIEDPEEIVVTDEASEEDEIEETSEEITEETESTEETEPGNVEETDVQEEAEQTEADQETAEETAESEAAETEEAEEISESEIVEETVESSEVIEETAESSAIENDEIIEEAPAATEPEAAQVPEVETTEATEAPEAETEKEAELQLFHEETTVNGILVTVKADRGVFPAGSYIVVTPVNDATADALVDKSRDENVNVAYSMTFDITVYNAEGIEIEPDNSKGNVYVSFKDTRVADNNLDVDVYHITDNKAVELTSEVDEDTVVAVTDSFSYYTVEFTYDSLQYVLEGDSTVALSVILDTVGLEGDVSDVSVSDESLFYAYNESGVWYVRANQAFNTEEWMKVTIAGTEYVIDVTDDASVAYFRRDNGYDIQGVPVIKTTYSNAGYKTQMSISGGSNIAFSPFDFDKEFGTDEVKGKVSASLAPSGNAVIVTYTVTNYTDEAKTIKIGSSADTMVASDDTASVILLPNGIQMRSNKGQDNGKEFFLIPGNGDFTTRWIGYYNDAYRNVFTNAESYQGTDSDSGIAFSWTIIVPANRSVTRTAVFTAGTNLTTYKINYNANGGSGTMAETTFINDVPGSLPECSFTREDYTFMGWAESSTGNKVYDDQGQITVTSNKYLYAVWLPSAVVEEIPTVSTVSVDPEDPTASQNLVYNGQPQELLATRGSSSSPNCPMVYSIDSVTWSEEIPTRTNAGTYTVYYKAQGDGSNYGDSVVGTLSVTIDRAPAPEITEANRPHGVENLVYTGSALPLITVPEVLPEGYKIQYMLNGYPTSEETILSSCKNSGDYEIRYSYAAIDNNHATPVPGGTINVTISKAPAPSTLSDLEKPTPRGNLEYTGNSQQLIDPPVKKPDGFNKVEYSTDGGVTWSTTPPRGTNAGDYEIYVRYTDTGNNHEPSVITAGPITATINKKPGPQQLSEEQVPTPKEDLVYTGEPIQLINEPNDKPEDYVIKYSTDGGETWTTTPPTGENAGEYEIIYKYEAPNDNYSPRTINGTTIHVTIAPQPGPQELADDQVPTLPEEDPVYTGEPIPLFEEPEDIPEGYEIEYSPDGGETWTNVPPTGTEAGDYEILVRYRNTDGNYDPEIIDGEPINATIAPQPGPEEITEDQLPTGKEDMEYTGEPIQLVNEPENKPEGYELEYSTDGGETWTTTPPTGTDAGDYEILVRYRDPDSNHTPDIIELDPINVTIDPKPAFDPETLTDDQKPTGNDGQEYTGDPIVLVTDPIEKPEGYDNVEYSTDGGRTWTTTPPMGTDAGEYEILVRYRDPDNNHVPNIVAGEPITVTIKPAHAPEIETLTGKQTPKGAENQPYLGKEVELIEKARELPENYDEVRYSIDGGKTWTTGIPTTDAAGIYVIKVKYVDTTGNHEDLMGEDIVVNILIPKDPTRFGYDFEGWFSDEEHKTPYDFAALEGNETAPAYAHWEEVNYTLIEGTDLKVNAGTDESATFRAVRNRNEQTTYSHYTYVTVDEVKLNEDEYSKRSGSIIIELDPEYIAKLAPGEHTLEIFFDDSYSVKTTFMVYAPAELPSTGETVNYIAIAAACMFFAMSATCIIVVVATKKKEEQQ